VGFGLDFAVVLNPVEAFCISEGEYFWGGLAGTWFWIDPVEDLIFVGMIQQMGQNRPDVRSLSRQLVYQAILEPANSK
jgi:CubicO group peptidase (beta-lactamase class C family)